MKIINKLKLKTKHAASFFLVATLIFSNAAFSGNIITVQAEETLKAFPGVRTESDSDGNVFLGGNYIEIGISKHGSFGTSLHPTDSITKSSYTSKAFHDSTQYSGLGLQSDGDGWNSGNDPVTGDFFLPGSPEERWMLSYKKNGSVYQYYVADRTYTGSLKQSWITEPSVVDTTVGDTLSARVYGKTAEGVEITMDYSFGVDDLEYLTHVTVKNTGDTDISDVVFVRSFDPDQDQQYNGEFDTYNKAICNPDKTKKAGADNYAMVVARGPVTLGGFFFLAIDNRARVSCNYSFGITDAYDSKLWTDETYSPTTSKTYADTEDVEMTTSNTNGYKLCDEAISIAFNVGTITSGNSDSLEFYSSLDPNVTESLDKLKKALGLTLDYGAESIKGLDGEGIYYITRESDNKTWKLVVDADKNYSLYDEEGTVIDTGVYDEDQEMGIKLIDEWYDCTLTIQKEAVGDTTYEPAQITIPARPQAPDDPSAPNLDNSAPSEIKASDVITTTDSIIVKAVEGQEYTLDGGKTWKKPDSNGQVEFTDLEDGKEYTIQTRIAATKESLCSYTSKGLTVKTRKMFDDLVETEYTGEYDAKSHIVKVSTGVEDARITYSLSLDTLETEGVEEPFAFTNAGTFTVYYKVEKDGYYTSYGDLQAVIKGRNVQVHINDNHKTYGDTEPELTYTVSGLLEGYELNGITLSRTEGEDAGEYTITGTHTSMPGNIYDVTFTNEGSFYITKRTMNITWKDTEFTYDGEEHIPAAEITNLVNGDDCELIVTGGQTDVGTYEAQIIGVTGDKSSNYEFPDNVDAVSYEIKKAAQTAPVVHAVAETIDGRADGKILDVTDHMEYRMKGESEYTDIDDTQLVDLTAGTYDVRMKADNNHFASEDTEVVVEAGRKLLVTLPETQTGYTLKADKNNLSWKETSVLTLNLADGYSKTADFAVKVNGVVIEADTEEGNVYTLSDVTQDQDVTVEGIADITNPTGEIVVSTNRWAKLLNTITFGTFFKDTQDVNITAEDKGSGVKSVEYYVSDKALTEEKIKTVVWTGFDGRFSINPNGNYVVYAKITDHAGNVTYLSTDGLVLDNAAPVITGIENGAVYCTPKTIKITDEHLDKITVNVGGEEKAIEADEFTLTPDTLGTQIITAADKAGNTTVYKVAFVEHDYSDVKVVEPTTLDKGYTIYTCVRCGESYRDNYTKPLGSSNLKPFDKKQLEEAMNEAKNRLEDTTKPLTEEEKKLYEDVYKQAKSLLNNIEKAEAIWIDSEGDIHYGNLDDVIKEAPEGSIITIKNDIVINGDIIIDSKKTIVIADDKKITIKNGAKFEIKEGSSVTNKGIIDIELGAKLNVKGDLHNENAITNNGDVVINGKIYNNGNVTNNNSATITGLGDIDNNGNIKNDGDIIINGTVTGKEDISGSGNIQEDVISTVVSEDEDTSIDSSINGELGNGKVIVIMDSLDKDKKKDGQVIGNVKIGSLLDFIKSSVGNTGIDDIKNGDDLFLRFTVVKIEDKVKMDDALVINEYAQSKSNDGKKLIVAEFLDLTYEIKKNNEAWTKLSELQNEIEITIAVPDELKGKNVYYILRNHDGVCDMLMDLDDDPDTITFRTDRFSTYAIVYEEEPQVQESVETGDNGMVNALAYMLMACLALASMGIILKKKSYAK